MESKPTREQNWRCVGFLKHDDETLTFFWRCENCGSEVSGGSQPPTDPCPKCSK